MQPSEARLVANSLGLVTATDAADRLTELSAIGYVYTPQAAYFIARRPDGWRRWSPNGDVAEDFSSAFEMTVFSASTEIRWIHDRDGIGHAFSVTESPGTASDGPLRFGGERSGLLWGRVHAADSAGGWASTQSPRVGAVMVPFTGAVADGDLLELVVAEYADVDRHGNVTIVDQRHIGVRVQAPAQEVPA